MSNADGAGVESTESLLEVFVIANVVDIKLAENGKVDRAKCTILEFRRTEDGVVTRPLESGLKLVASPGDSGTRFSLPDGQVLSSDRAADLGTVLGLGGSSYALEQMFGSDSPRSVGDTWAGRSGVIADYLRDIGMPVRADSIASKATLVSVDTETPDARVVVGFEVRAVDLLVKPPENSSFVDSSLELKWQLHLPERNDRLITQEANSGGGRMTVERDERRVTIEYRFVHDVNRARIGE